MPNNWTAQPLTVPEIAAWHAATAKLDPGFAYRQAEFYEGRTAAQLRSLAAGAWDANNYDGYILARSYLRAIGG